MAPQPPADVTTLEAPGASLESKDTRARRLSLTIAHHSEIDRVGWRHLFDAQAALAVSRREPTFHSPRGDGHGALDDPYISRTPFTIRSAAGAIVIDAGEHGELRVDGGDLRGEARLDDRAVERGVAIELGARAVLLLNSVDAELAEASLPALGLVGESDALQHVRAQITRVAEHSVPVLIRGESGTGKELVAQAIHHQSSRRNAPFVSVNLGAIVASTAAAALFGHARGAFTGAVEASDGYFVAAEGGTLFLDEVAEAPPELQVALLRVLESHEVQPVGASLPRKVNVRLVAATDADLPRQIDEGKFRLPLMMRLGGYELHVPPLRERRDDIGPLLAHFARSELEALGHADKLASGAHLWMPATVVSMALRHDWPGNVRQLMNFVRRMALDHAQRDTIVVAEASEWLQQQQRLGGSPAQEGSDVTDVQPTATPRRALESYGEDEIRQALGAHDYRPGPAAEALGLSRSSLYELLKRHPGIRTASSLAREEIAHELDGTGGDVASAAQRLGVSERALQLRMKRLKMS